MTELKYKSFNMNRITEVVEQHQVTDAMARSQKDRVFYCSVKSQKNFKYNTKCSDIGSEIWS